MFSLQLLHLYSRKQTRLQNTKTVQHLIKVPTLQNRTPSFLWLKSSFTFVG